MLIHLSPKQDDDTLLKDFVKEWLGTMQRDDLMPLSLLLRVMLVSNLKFGLLQQQKCLVGCWARVVAPLGSGGHSLRQTATSSQIPCRENIRK